MFIDQKQNSSHKECRASARAEASVRPPAGGKLVRHSPPQASFSKDLISFTLKLIGIMLFELLAFLLIKYLGDGLFWGGFFGRLGIMVLSMSDSAVKLRLRWGCAKGSSESSRIVENYS